MSNLKMFIMKSSYVLFPLLIMGCESGGPTSSNEIRESLKAIKLTEIHYHPIETDGLDSDTLYEFLELKNTSNAAVDMSDVGFTKGIIYTFPKNSKIPAHGFYVIAKDSAHFHSLYGFAADGVYVGKLKNSGETITLTDLRSGGEIFSVTYGDKNSPPWPKEADGDGYSLVPVEVNPTGDQKSADQWSISKKENGSPGKDD